MSASSTGPVDFSLPEQPEPAKAGRMSENDPRHGTSAGYIAGCRDACCWRAKQRYDKTRRLELHTTGRYRKVPALGPIRRVQALQALGWSAPQIAKRAGINYRHIYNLHRHETVYTSTLARIERAYDELSMELPPETTTGERISARRARNHARRQGWPPPLAWDDIDDPHEGPKGVAGREPRRTYIDPIAVGELLAGRTVDSTPAEKTEAMRRWLAMGRSAASLARRHGWKDGRYVPRSEDVA